MKRKIHSVDDSGDDADDDDNGHDGDENVLTRLVDNYDDDISDIGDGDEKH